jgi:hypothetical protein
MKFSNMFSFISNRTLSIILLILCILVALAFSNMTLFNPTPKVEGMLSLGDANAITLLIKKREDAIQKQIINTFDQPMVIDVLSSQGKTSDKFATLRSRLVSNPATLNKINLIINDGYAEIYKSLMENYGTNLDVIPSLTQGCNGDEACVLNTKLMAESISSGSGGAGGLGV